MFSYLNERYLCSMKKVVLVSKYFVIEIKNVYIQLRYICTYSSFLSIRFYFSCKKSMYYSIKKQLCVP